MLLGMVGRLARTPSEKPLSGQVDWGEEKEEVSFEEKVSFTGPLALLSKEST